ncbi:MAG: hypothetical protein KKA65_02840 [Nanoarchaeota archaeon]|nr:hypothetical protein [Nanoarchaeota archaeon]MBU4352549.1 hypothetical protein [Nanoarchaeota archaeon]MBU4456414.1 hypothetical protein [Nanoarchaeota archaeon]MCG2720193.1 hypothetical protein [Nanoarchaeota archaeon]
MKITFFFIIFIVLLSSFAIGEEIKIYDTEYVSGETVQAELVYPNLDVSKLSLLDSNKNKVTVGFISTLINDANYISFNLPVSLIEGNYTLQFKEKKLINGTVTDVIIEKSFNVVQGDNSFSINPGFIKLNSQETSLKIKLQHSKGLPIEITISDNDDAINLIRNSITLNPGESKFLFADYVFQDIIENSKIILSFDSRNYEIPLLKQVETIEEPEVNMTEEIIDEEVVKNETVEEDFSGALVILNEDAKNLKDSITQDITIEGSVRLMNVYSSPLHNIRFEVDENLQEIVILNISSFEIFEPEVTYVQYIWINKNKNVKPGEYKGNINILSDEGATQTIILDLVFEAEEKVEQGLNITEYRPMNISINFSELREDTKEDKSKSLTIAIILIIIVLGLLGLLAYRLRPVKGVKKLSSYLKELKK